MSLKQKLIDFGCGREFVEIALGYSKFYKPSQDIETFVEFVENEYAKIEAEEMKKKLEDESENENELFDEFEDEEDLYDDGGLYDEYDDEYDDDEEEEY